MISHFIKNPFEQNLLKCMLVNKKEDPEVQPGQYVSLWITGTTRDSYQADSGLENCFPIKSILSCAIYNLKKTPPKHKHCIGRP